MSKKFYITTAIDYVNSTPHIGTAYEKIGADVLARFKRLSGIDTFFLMGTDEHSLNVERQAKKEGKGPLPYCDIMAEKFKLVWRNLHIAFDDFIRTTQKRHIDAVQALLTKIYEAGDIYKGKYQGWYCVSCESFLKDADLKEGICPVHQKKPEWIEEENYFFALSRYRDKLLEYIENHPSFIQPETRKNEILNIIQGGLEDISISRSSAKWGIPIPFAQDQVTYVWFDALINYISGVGYRSDDRDFSEYWPCDVHIIGKDITKFHCIIWPAMLMSAGMSLPKTVFAHGFVYISGNKMSKTQGTVIDPLEAAKKYGADALRYFLMREVPFDKDGDFSWEKFTQRFNADLANDLGNLLNRVLTMIQKYSQGYIPYVQVGDELLYDLSLRTIDTYIALMDELKFNVALQEVWGFIQRCNKYIEEQAPWKLHKEKDKEELLQSVLYSLAECLRQIAILVSPFMPQIAEQMWQQLNMPTPLFQETIDSLRDWEAFKSKQAIGEITALFPRIDSQE